MEREEKAWERAKSVKVTRLYICLNVSFFLLISTKEGDNATKTHAVTDSERKLDDICEQNGHKWVIYVVLKFWEIVGKLGTKNLEESATSQKCEKRKENY